MGKKRMAHKQASAQPSLTLRDERPEVQPPAEARPASPQPLPQTSTTQATPMVTLDELTAYLKRTNPNMDWEATLAGLGQIGGGTSIASGVPVIPTPTLEIPTTVNPPTTVPTSSTPITNEPSPKETAPSATSKPSPEQPQIEPLDISPLSAYHDPVTEEKKEEEGGQKVEEKKDGETGEKVDKKESEEGGGKTEETPVAEPVPEGERREEVDLNETARKQGLMTDDEFQSILDGVNRREEETAEMAEGLDLASKAVGEG